MTLDLDALAALAEAAQREMGHFDMWAIGSDGDALCWDPSDGEQFGMLHLVPHVAPCEAAYVVRVDPTTILALIDRLRAAEAEVKRLRLVVDGELGRWDVRAIAARREAERLRDIAADAIEGDPT